MVNGSLTGPIANGSVPPGWTTLQESPDTMDQFNNVGLSGYLDFGATPGASPDGGTWVGMAIDVGFVESFGQTLTGLTMGAQYKISWYAGNFGVMSLGFTNPNAIEALINGTVVGTGATLPCTSNWVSESVIFTAPSTNPTLSFRLANITQSYMSIDGISVTATVPEPACGALACFGMFVAHYASALRRSSSRT